MGTVISGKTTPVPYSGIKKKKKKHQLFLQFENAVIYFHQQTEVLVPVISVPKMGKRSVSKCSSIYFFTFSNDFCNSHPVPFLRIGNYWQIYGNILFLRAVWQFKTSDLLARRLLPFYSLRQTKCKPIISFFKLLMLLTRG